MDLDRFREKLEKRIKDRATLRAAMNVPRLVRDALERLNYEFLFPDVKWKRNRFLVILRDRKGFSEFQLFSITADGYLHPRFEIRNRSEWISPAHLMRRLKRRPRERFSEFGRVRLRILESEWPRFLRSLASEIDRYGISIRKAYRESRKFLD